MPEQWLDFDGYIGQVQFGDGWARHAGKDWRHTFGQNLLIERPTNPNRGHGLVIQASKDEFYLVGVNYRMFFRPRFPLTRHDLFCFTMILRLDDDSEWRKVISTKMANS